LTPIDYKYVVDDIDISEIHEHLCVLAAALEKYHKDAENTAATLRTEIQRLKEGAWRPISEAPRDGTMILGWCHVGDQAVCCDVVWWNKDYRFWDRGGAIVPKTSSSVKIINTVDVTHWLPLPSPPDNVSDKGGG
jgi:hypothetical protein